MSTDTFVLRRGDPHAPAALYGYAESLNAHGLFAREADVRRLADAWCEEPVRVPVALGQKRIAPGIHAEIVTIKAVAEGFVIYGGCVTGTAMETYVETWPVYEEGASQTQRVAPTIPARHPMQPVVALDEGGRVIHRFKQNAIVRYLLDEGPFDLNHLATLSFSVEDHEQFAQLIGYSVSGFCDLSYACEEVKDRAYAASQALLAKEDR